MLVNFTSVNHIYGMTHGLYIAAGIFTLCAMFFFALEHHFSLAKTSMISVFVAITLLFNTLFFEYTFNLIDTQSISPAFIDILVIIAKYGAPLTAILTIYIYKQWFYIQGSTNFNQFSRFLYVLAFATFIVLLFLDDHKESLIAIQINMLVTLLFFLVHTAKSLQFIDTGKVAKYILLLYLIGGLFFGGVLIKGLSGELNYHIVAVNHLFFAALFVMLTFIMVRHNQQQLKLLKKVKSFDAALLAFDLLKGIKEKQFHLVYQPQINLEDEMIYGVEALLRWEHPTKGFIPPDEFIVLAEKADLIHRISRWVINEAIKQSALFTQQGIRVTMSINFSAKDLTPHMASYVGKILRAYNVPASDIIIEITETALMTNVEKSLETIKSLIDMGCAISLDDYGTGFSSLSKLRQLSVSELKLDREFISNFQTDNEKYIIVSSTIEMGNKLQLRTLAEGVETQSEYDCLKLKNCRLVQGYFIARPMRPEAFIEWINETSYKIRKPKLKVS